MKPHEASNHLSQSVRVVLHYSMLHVLTIPSTGRVHNYRQPQKVKHWISMSVMALGNDEELQRMYDQKYSAHTWSHMCIIKYVMTVFCVCEVSQYGSIIWLWQVELWCFFCHFRIIVWTWAGRGQRKCWSNEEYVYFTWTMIYRTGEILFIFIQELAQQFSLKRYLRHGTTSQPLETPFHMVQMMLVRTKNTRATLSK